MTLEDLLRYELSKRHTSEIARMVDKNPALLHRLWEISLSDDEPVNWRAAWVLKGIREEEPVLVEPFLPQMRLALPKLKKDGVKREFLRILLEYGVPDDEEELGCMLSACFEWLANPAEPIAVKAHCMSVLLDISRQIPEIIPELQTTVELAMAEGSAGIINRGSKVLKELRKMQAETD
ncbi:MAG: hypothetical protein ACLFPE_03255 [Bacteroidales bacterium]